MKHKSKRYREAKGRLNLDKIYSPKEAIELLKQFPQVKFNQTMELCIHVAVDSKKADQQVRSTVILPYGTGKKAVVVVFATGDKASQARDSGADFVGSDDLAEKIKGGWSDFTTVVASPDMMRLIGPLGKILGPRGLMPSTKTGTVTQDVAKAVKDIKSGKIEFKVDKGNNIHTIFGKLSFSMDQLVDNFKSLMDSIVKSRPPSVKGNFIRSITMSTTMGPGIKLSIA